MGQLFKFRGLDYKNYELNFKQKLFCDGYLNSKGDSISAVESAGYKIGNNRKLASSIASENLTKPNICAYLNLKLKESGLDDEFVDKQLLFLVNQYSDLKVKLSAIDTYYKIKGRYAPKKLDIKEEKNIYKDMTDDELDRLAWGENYELYKETKTKEQPQQSSN
jgi:phage terminase small subunit